MRCDVRENNSMINIDLIFLIKNNTGLVFRERRVRRGRRESVPAKPNLSRLPAILSA